MEFFYFENLSKVNSSIKGKNGSGGGSTDGKSTSSFAGCCGGSDWDDNLLGYFGCASEGDSWTVGNSTSTCFGSVSGCCVGSGSTGSGLSTGGGVGCDTFVVDGGILGAVSSGGACSVTEVVGNEGTVSSHINFFCFKM